MERTVEDVIPALETNFAGIKEVLESLMKSYKSKDEEFGAFRKEYNIQVRIYQGSEGREELTSRCRIS